MSLPSNPTCGYHPGRDSDHPRYRSDIINGGAACIAAGCAEVRTGAERTPFWMSKKRRGVGWHGVCNEFPVRIRCVPMAEGPPDLPRIPENICAAFREAVGLFCGWWGSRP